MSKNNKAFTVVELIITFSIVMVITIGLFKVIDTFRDTEQKKLIQKNMIIFRNQVVQTIKDDFYTNTVVSIDPVDCDETEAQQCIKVTLKNAEKNLIVKKDSIKYGDKEIKLPLNLANHVKFVDDIILDVQKLDSKRENTIIHRNFYRINIEMWYSGIKGMNIPITITAVSHSYE